MRRFPRYPVKIKTPASGNGQPRLPPPTAAAGLGRQCCVIRSGPECPPPPPNRGSEFRSHLIWLLHSVSTLLLKSSHTGFCVPGAQNTTIWQNAVLISTQKRLHKARLVLRRQWGGEGGLALTEEGEKSNRGKARTSKSPEWGHGKIFYKKRKNASRCLAAFNRPSKLLW